MHQIEGNLICEGKCWRVEPNHSGVKHELRTLSHIISKNQDTLYDMVQNSDAAMLKSVHNFFRLLMSKAVQNHLKAKNLWGYQRLLKAEEEFMHDFIAEPTYKIKRRTLIRKLNKPHHILPRIIRGFGIKCLLCL